MTLEPADENVNPNASMPKKRRSRWDASLLEGVVSDTS